MSNNMPASILDWVRAPTPEDKRELCGKVTQIVEYTNGTVGIMAFYCHRWDCERCEAERKKVITQQIMNTLPYWFMMVIENRRYSAVTKRVNRAGAKYFALGTGENVLALTNRKVFKESKPVYGENLHRLIYLYLDCPYSYRHRRFRHSRGLFPKTGTPTTAHIRRKIAVTKSKEHIVATLEVNGYSVTNRERDIDYMRPILLNEQSLTSILEKEKKMVKWVE